MPSVSPRDTDWRRDLERELNELQKGFAGLSAETRTFQKAVISDLEAIQSFLANLTEKVNRPPAPTNWVAIGSLLLATSTVLGTLGAFALDPVKAQVGAIDDRLSRVERYDTDTSSEFAQLSTSTDRNTLWLRAHESEINKMLEINGEQSAEIGNLKSWLRDIDEKGSRKWVKTTED